MLRTGLLGKGMSVNEDKALMIVSICSVVLFLAVSIKNT